MAEESFGLSSRQELEVGITLDRSSLGLGGSCVSENREKIMVRREMGFTELTLRWVELAVASSMC
jgi:hypothetical protein